MAGQGKEKNVPKVFNKYIKGTRSDGDKMCIYCALIIVARLSKIKTKPTTHPPSYTTRPPTQKERERVSIREKIREKQEGRRKRRRRKVISKLNQVHFLHFLALLRYVVLTKALKSYLISRINMLEQEMKGFMMV